MSDLLTIEQVAEILQVSPETVARRFANATGVIDLGTPSKRRRYRVLRIPRVVVEKYVLSRGGRIAVEPVPMPLKKPLKKPQPKQLANEENLSRDLALVANQHGQDARNTLDRIARRARAMTYVPADRWADMVWVDEDDEA
ncbi:MAG: helix-turn-helix domain-containing protein [Candidatus Sulfotelmatobacter sp.]|jgi:hypothetical protein